MLVRAYLANVADDAKLLRSFIRSKMNADGVVTDEATLQAIYSVADALLRVVTEQKTDSGYTII
jgi:hypothetical protein